MKLSEVLKDWPEKSQCQEHQNNDETCVGCALGRSDNQALTSCDREIDREALAKEIFKQNYALDFYLDVKESTREEYRERADAIISTMPNWLKRIEK